MHDIVYAPTHMNVAGSIARNSDKFGHTPRALSRIQTGKLMQHFWYYNSSLRVLSSLIPRLVKFEAEKKVKPGDKVRFRYYKQSHYCLQ